MYYYMCVYLYGNPSEDIKNQIKCYVKTCVEPEPTQMIMSIDMYDQSNTSFVDAYPWAFLIHPQYISNNNNNNTLESEESTLKQHLMEINLKDFVNEMPFIVICFVAGIINLPEYFDYINNVDLYLVPYRNLPLNLQKLISGKIRVFQRIFLKFQLLFIMNMVVSKPTDRKYFVKDFKFYFNKDIHLRDTVFMENKHKISTIKYGNNDPLKYSEEIHYNVSNLLEAIKLWDDLKNISLNTYYPLKDSKFDKILDKFNFFDYLQENSSHIDHFVRFKSDQNGVAGFDSKLYLHHRRSWVYNSIIYNSSKNKALHIKKSPTLSTKKNKNNLTNTATITIDDNRPFSSQEDSIIYIVSLAIEVVGNKNFTRYYWKIAKTFLSNDPHIDKLLCQRSLKALQQRSFTLKATITQSCDFSRKVDFFRNYNNINQLLQEIKIFHNIDTNFESIIAVIQSFFNNLTLEIVDRLPTNVSLGDIFNTDKYNNNESPNFINYELVPELKESIKTFKYPNNDHVTPFSRVGEACVMNLILGHAVNRLSCSDSIAFFNNIGHRKILNAIRKLSATGIFNRSNRLNFYKITNGLQTANLFKSIFDIPLSQNYLKCIKSNVVRLQIDRDHKSFNELSKLYNNTSVICSNIHINSDLNWLLCQNHLNSHDINKLASLIVKSHICVILLPPSILNNQIPNYNKTSPKDFCFTKGLTIKNFVDYSKHNYPLTFMPIDSNSSTIIGINYNVTSSFTLGHLSTNYELSGECVNPKKLFYHVHIQPFPDINYYITNSCNFPNDNISINSIPSIPIDCIYNNNYKLLDLHIDDYYNHIKIFMDDILSDIPYNNTHLDLCYKISQFILEHLLHATSSGIPYQNMIDQTIEHFNMIIYGQNHIIISIIRLLISCGLIIEIPLDILYIVHGNYSHEWCVSTSQSGQHSQSFISRPWIDHKTGDICSRMSNYMYNLIEGIIRENPGISKTQIIERVGTFVHNSIIENMLTVLECDLFIIKKRYPIKQIKINLFGPPSEKYVPGFEDCYFLNDSPEFCFIYPNSL